jgi:hypothetical protein
MKVIGAGLPRTATLTQKIALEMLGFGPCYHMTNLLMDTSLTQRWSDAFETQADWDKIFDGFEATVDWPGSFHWKELVQVYPDAKVLLSVRDAAAWEKSMRDTIWGIFFGDCLMRDVSNARERVDSGWAQYMNLLRQMWLRSGLLGGPDGSAAPGELAAAMERYNAEVQATVPAERLLVWKPQDGWAPLCEFLEVPVPEAPLPRVNDSGAFVDRIIEGALGTLNTWFERQQESLAATAK